MAWDLSRPDWAARLRADQSLLPDLPHLTADAARADAIFSRLRLPDVPGQPSMLDAAGPWQHDLVRAIFGSWDETAGVRHIREFFAMVPKKSSKTTGSAAIMVTALLMSKRPRAEFILVAPRLEAADLAFRQAVGMIECDLVLAKKFHIQDHLRTITYRPTGARLKVKSFDPKVVTGSKPVGVLIDELHVIAQSRDADRVLGQMRGGIVPNPEGFLLTITTQSERAPEGVFRSELIKARRVRDGEIKLPILPLLYEFPPEMLKGGDLAEWRYPANWWMVTPNRGRPVPVERLIPDYEAAKESGEGELRRWASQHLNVEIGIGLSDGWSGAEFWEACKNRNLTLDELIQRSEVIVCGIDGGGLDDLLGLAFLGREKLTGKWLLWSHAWAHLIVLERRKSIAGKLRDFEKEESLTIVDMPNDALSEMVDLVVKVEESGKLAEKTAVGVDQIGIIGITEALVAAGIAFDRIVAVPQGYKLNGAIKTTETKLAGGEIEHGGLDLMTWSVGNAKVEHRGNAILITKQASGTAKIDPLMALFDAVAVMATNPEACGSVYTSERGLTFF